MELVEKSNNCPVCGWAVATLARAETTLALVTNNSQQQTLLILITYNRGAMAISLCHYLHLATCSINYVFFVLSGPLRGTPNKIAYGRFPSCPGHHKTSMGVIPIQGNVFSAPTPQLLCNAWCWWWWYLASVWAGVRFSDHQNIADICTTVGGSTQSCSYDTLITTCTIDYVDMNQESFQFQIIRSPKCRDWTFT